MLNYAPHYRAPIFDKMDERLHCDFYFGKDLREPLVKMECSRLKGFKKELVNVYWGNWVWRRGVIRLAFDPRYQTYLISGEPHTLSIALFNLIARLLGKKVYSWQHGINNLHLSPGKLFNQRVLIGMQNGVFLYGNHARETMLALGFKPSKLHVIYNSLDYDLALQCRQKVAGESSIYPAIFHNNDPVLLFIGRLTPVKQLDKLVRLFLQLNKNRISCNLILIGKGLSWIGCSRWLAILLLQHAFMQPEPCMRRFP